MQYRCFTCGFLFYNGMPPVEALSDTQHSVVFREEYPRMDLSDEKLALEQTIYNGMSPSNFCEICMKAIMDNPKAWADDVNNTEHWLEQDASSVWCICEGLTYYTGEPKQRKDWVTINRLRMIHYSEAKG